MNDPLLELQQVKKYFEVGHGVLFRRSRGLAKAVDGVSFSIREQQTFSLVGESGCGKTTIARMVLGLEQPTDGTIRFRGHDVWLQPGRTPRDYRRSVQAMFQDPWSSLDPRMRVGAIVGEPLVFNTALSRSEVRGRVEELLAQVGLQSRDAQLYPHEFSGGQRQRIALARALALSPSLIVLDEPVSALDVSIRAQIMNLLKRTKQERGLSYLLIAHNLATVRYLSDRIAVVYLGRIVEMCDSELLFCAPVHPYTRALLEAALPGHPRNRRELARLSGEVPSPLAPPPGCAFNSRCPDVMPLCSQVTASLREVAPGHWVACLLHGEGI